MVKELSFCTISHVIDSWDAMKRIKDYDIVAGRMLMKRYVVGTESCLGHVFVEISRIV